MCAQLPHISNELSLEREETKVSTLMGNMGEWPMAPSSQCLSKVGFNTGYAPS